MTSNWTLRSDLTTHTGKCEEDAIHHKFLTTMSKAKFKAHVKTYEQQVTVVHERINSNNQSQNSRIPPKDDVIGKVNEHDPQRRKIYGVMGVYCLLLWVLNQMLIFNEDKQTYDHCYSFVVSIEASNSWLRDMGSSYDRVSMSCRYLLIELRIPMHRPCVVNKLTTRSFQQNADELKQNFIGIDSQLEDLLTAAFTTLRIKLARMNNPNDAQFHRDNIRQQCVFMSGMSSGAKTTSAREIAKLMGIYGTCAYVEFLCSGLKTEHSLSSITGSAGGLEGGELETLADKLALMMDFLQGQRNIIGLVVFDEIHLAHLSCLQVIRELVYSGKLPAHRHPGGFILCDGILFIFTANWGEREMSATYKSLYTQNLSQVQLNHTFVKMVEKNMIEDGVDAATIGRMKPIIAFPPLTDEDLIQLFKQSIPQAIKNACLQQGLRKVKVGSTAIANYTDYMLTWFTVETGVRVCIDSVGHVVGKLISRMDMIVLLDEQVQVLFRCNFEKSTCHLHAALTWTIGETNGLVETQHAAPIMTHTTDSMSIAPTSSPAPTPLALVAPATTGHVYFHSQHGPYSPQQNEHDTSTSSSSVTVNNHDDGEYKALPPGSNLPSQLMNDTDAAYLCGSGLSPRNSLMISSSPLSSSTNAIAYPYNDPATPFFDPLSPDVLSLLSLTERDSDEKKHSSSFMDIDLQPQHTQPQPPPQHVVNTSNNSNDVITDVDRKEDNFTRLGHFQQQLSQYTRDILHQERQQPVTQRIDQHQVTSSSTSHQPHLPFILNNNNTTQQQPTATESYYTSLANTQSSPPPPPQQQQQQPVGNNSNNINNVITDVDLNENNFTRLGHFQQLAQYTRDILHQEHQQEMQQCIDQYQMMPSCTTTSSVSPTTSSASTYTTASQQQTVTTESSIQHLPGALEVSDSVKLASDHAMPDSDSPSTPSSSSRSVNQSKHHRRGSSSGSKRKSLSDDDFEQITNKDDSKKIKISPRRSSISAKINDVPVKINNIKSMTIEDVVVTKKKKKNVHSRYAIVKFEFDPVPYHYDNNKYLIGLENEVTVAAYFKDILDSCEKPIYRLYGGSKDDFTQIWKKAIKKYLSNNDAKAQISYSDIRTRGGIIIAYDDAKNYIIQ